MLEKEKIRLAYRFNPEQVFAYRSQTEIIQDITAAGEIARHNENRWNSKTLIKVLKVEADGSAHLILTNELSSEMEGENILNFVPRREVIYLLQSPQGKVLESAGFNPQLIFPLPEEALQKGEGWSGEQTFYFLSPAHSYSYKMNFVLQDWEKTQTDLLCRVGFQVPETKFTLPIPVENARMEQLLDMQGYFSFLAQAGRVAKAEFVTHTIAKLKDTVFDTTINYRQSLE